MTDNLTSTFDTGYIGAHRWHVEGQNSYRWTCVCGDTGNVAGNLSFVLHSFAEHAYRKLEEAAIALVLAPLPHTAQVRQTLVRKAKQEQQSGDRDRGNILMGVANYLAYEAQETQAEQYRSLEWYPWPEKIEGVEGSGSVATDVEGAYQNHWLYVCPRQDGHWAWETWLINPATGDETRLAQGTRPNRADAQLSAWEALVNYTNDQEEDEPF